MTYTITGDGAVTVAAAYKPGSRTLAMMPRFGIELVVSPGLDRLAWYGRGPLETYVDRQFERVGLYSSTVPDSGWSTRGRRRTGTRPTCGGWS